MNKTRPVILGLLLLAVTAAQAQFTCTTNNGAITITGYTGSGGAVSIPSAITGLPVTAIGIGVFDGNTALTSVTIPSSVTSLGSSAFYKCTSLTNLYFLGNAPAGGSTAFTGDTNTTIYYFPGATGWTSPLDGLTVVFLPYDFVLNPANTNSLIITGYAGSGSSAAANIPASMEGLPVTGIGYGAFAYNTVLSSVTIPGSVASIGDTAFADCSSLLSVTINNGVTSIGQFAFANCSHLGGPPSFSGMYIPASVTNIGVGAFASCQYGPVIAVDPSNSHYVCVSNELFNPGQTILFEGATEPGGSYIIPASVTNIGSAAFEGTSPTNVIIPNNVISIGSDAFNSCNLSAITLPKSVVSIGAGAFAYNLFLTNIMVNATNSFYSSTNGVLFNLKKSALIQYPTGLTGNYIIPGSVTNIGSEAFAGCWKLTGITISNGVTSIGTMAFAGAALTAIAIPASVTNIGNEAFQCHSLTAITVDPQNPAYSSVNGVLFDHGQTTLIQFPTSNGIKNYTIPGSVTNIADGAFFQSLMMTNVTMPASVIRIGNEAFEACSLLAGMTIPGSVTTLGTNAFYDCPALTAVVITNGLTGMGYGAFQDCAHLAGITIPGSVTNLGDYALADCPLLTHVYFTGNAPVADGSVCASDLIATNYYLPGTTGWTSPFAGATSSLWIPFTYTTSAGSITINSYTGPGGSVYIPAAINGVPVTGIGNNAFIFNTTMTSITIPTSVMNIGSDAFESCAGLTNVVIPDSVLSIGDYAFISCRNLTNITLANGVKSIGSDTFFACALASITLPNSVTNIGLGAFAACTNLINIYSTGNAPGASQGVFSGDPNAIVYYLPNTTGWTSPFDGVPALPWLPQIQTGGVGFGLQNGQFGFNLNWAGGQSVTVNVSTNLASPVWTPLQSVTLTNGSYYFSEPLQTNSPGRYYQLSSP